MKVIWRGTNIKTYHELKYRSSRPVLFGGSPLSAPLRRKKHNIIAVPVTAFNKISYACQ